MTPDPKTQSADDARQAALAPATGYTARLAELKALGDERELAAIQKMLDDVGVPEWVQNSDSDGVPSNAPSCRLRWFVSRRKNVELWETDQTLAAEMRENLEAAKRYNR